MGAEGTIGIWRFDKMLEAFPEAEKLWPLLPHSYKDDLDGVKYVHSYWGEPDYDRWDNIDYWLQPYDGEGPSAERQKEFRDWLQANQSGEWEVWT